jgi:hypothetical protein
VNNGDVSWVLNKKKFSVVSVCSFFSVPSVVKLFLCNKSFTNEKFLRSAKKNRSLQNAAKIMFLSIKDLFFGMVFVYKISGSLKISERWKVVKRKRLNLKGGLLCVNFYILHF